MTFMYVFAHYSILRRKRRGINPKEIKDNNVFVFSSNYQLYGDISKRIMESLREFVPNMEVYSIDEAFLELDNSMGDLDLLKYAHEICNKVEKWVGIRINQG